MGEQSNVRTFAFNQAGLEKWMHQNRAQYTGDIIEGTLLDSFVLMCKRGYAAVYEHPLNEWCSDYRVEFEAGAAQEVWNRWYDFEAATNTESG
mgnify:CR=1 FL=1